MESIFVTHVCSSHSWDGGSLIMFDMSYFKSWILHGDPNSDLHLDFALSKVAPMATSGFEHRSHRSELALRGAGAILDTQLPR